MRLHRSDGAYPWQVVPPRAPLLGVVASAERRVEQVEERAAGREVLDADVVGAVVLLEARVLDGKVMSDPVVVCSC